MTNKVTLETVGDVLDLLKDIDPNTPITFYNSKSFIKRLEGQYFTRMGGSKEIVIYEKSK